MTKQNDFQNQIQIFLTLTIILTIIIFSGCNTKTTTINKPNTKTPPNQNTNKEKQIIVEEMMKNHSNIANNKNEIIEIRNEKDILKEKELEEANTRFNEIYNKNNIEHKQKLLPPKNDNIYLGAFPDFGGSEDNITSKKLTQFKKLTKKQIIWAYFSNNWFNGIKYPKKEIHIINNKNIIPFVRFMPRSNQEQFTKEKTFTLQNIINGKFDTQITKWAKDAKKDNIPLLVDFAVEMNGDWFSWSGYYNGKGTKDKYDNPNYYDGPEKYKDAYRHIIDIFRKENVTHITWFFHPDIYSNPDEEWNKPKYYYPGDDYIDWIGISIYGPQNPKEDYWENFSEILKNKYNTILEISKNKPIALLEFGVTDNHPLGKKDEWLEDAFQTILNKKYINFKAISYWHENWEQEDNLFATLRIDSSKTSLNTYNKYIQNKQFITTPIFTNTKINTTTKSEQDTQIYIPQPKTTWQWQLSGKINTSYDVDMYDIDLAETPQNTINDLHARGIKVICYFSAGSWEEYREDAEEFPKEVLGKVLDGWPDEKWLDISNYEKFAHIVEKRLDLAVQKNCDGVEPDNIDSYTNNNGFDLTYQDQLKYNKWLAEQAHKRNLSIGLKNDLEQIEELANYFDFAINEQCFQYDECKYLTPFIKQNKAVFGVEYEQTTSQFCEKANNMNFSWLEMNYDLDGTRKSCNE